VPQKIDPTSPVDELFRFLAERTPDVYWTSDEQGVLRYITPQVSSLLNQSANDLIGLKVTNLIYGDDVAEASSLQAALLASGEMITLAYRLRRNGGDSVWVECTMHPLHGDDKKLRGFAGVWRDITERKRIEEAFEHQAYHDGLTGLPNRLLFEDRIAIALAQAKRLGHFVAVLFIDLDRLKVINDTLGHAVGDDVLRTISQRLRTCVRAADTLARVGGDEFTLVATNIRHEEDAVRIAKLLLQRASEPVVVNGRELFVRASIGIAIFPHDGQDASRLLAAADEAMYRCKNLGGNGWQLHHSMENERALERLALEMDLNRALERNEFLVLYQPLIDVATQRITAVEALVRWNHPARGLMAPAAFLDVAEETGLIIPIGEKIIDESCRQAREWLDGGWTNACVSVNLSSRQFEQSTLLERVDEALRVHKLPASVLQLEITEGTALRNLERTVQTLKQLRERGIRVAIDDFGMGYSSLAYLKDLPVDSLKIDKSFLVDIPESRDAAIICAVIAMGHALGLTVVAEGVERSEQMTFLREQRCDVFQGYLFSRPTTPADIARMLDALKIELAANP
jgi:diguanylate cyclase (GGDEF)-like protein/PAS domain S-box-containing protein